ncbi:hypothetical protein CANCADRAFT_71768 [Tortispora caseinolytica NRRL Y-17796]|uniref:AAA+ ATPase domain-containing protein n=1 Tax=Tortispora caseinolytica NRRL Y-17796 TaxID=767744 RepID=A0A1E4TIF0_9ASCO|nr:hypothetical protein CANCADRAFT_71768 [Tortispora caseinolytica NRRL Y-17796]
MIGIRPVRSPIGLFGTFQSCRYYSLHVRPPVAPTALTKLCHPRALARPVSSIFSITYPRFASSYSSNHANANADLSFKESHANRHRRDPEIQAAFYRDLLAANFPNVVVARYESPGIAANSECDQLYVQALRMCGFSERAALMEQRLAANEPLSPNPDPAANVGSSSNPLRSLSGLFSRYNGSQAERRTGNRSDPIHVIVQESKFAVIARWIRMLIVFSLMFYALLMVLALLAESSGVFKGPSQVNEDSNVQNKPTVKFDDVKGCDEAVAELSEIVDFLRDPSKFTALGGKLPKGVLLTGPPGTGKTMLARAVAGEAGVPFFFMSGSEFDEMYVGVGARRVRDLFAAARAKAPAIVFIDELDAVGGKRSSKDQAYIKQTLNQLLVDLDGFSQTSGVIFIAATNFPELLDKALLRPGRFDKMVNVDLPDVRGRSAILKHYLAEVESAPNIDPSIIARGTTGMSGADLKNLVNQAAIHASQLKAPSVQMSHLEWAKDKILMGAERKSMVLTEEARRNTAFHEAGHAIAAMYTEGATSLYKATILPRGRALGITFQLPEMDKYEQTRKELRARLDVCMGGKIAEEALRGPDNVTSGCSSDLQQATAVARAMVLSFGMSDAVGPIQLSDDYNGWSENTKMLAEAEIRKLLTESEQRVRELLKGRLTELRRLANALLEYETLDRVEIEKVVKGEKINKARTVSNTVIKSTPDSVKTIPGISAGTEDL